jgi:hypothetical protein
MKIDTNTKKLIFIFGGGIILFYAFKQIKPYGSEPKKKGKKSGGRVTEKKLKDAVLVKNAYASAAKAGESKDFLDEMNAEFSREYGLRVLNDRGANTFFVADLSGNKIE